MHPRTFARATAPGQPLERLCSRGGAENAEGFFGTHSTPGPDFSQKRLPFLPFIPFIPFLSFLSFTQL
jgi:hypothetical protein